jgi:hypothetical protein
MPLVGTGVGIMPRLWRAPLALFHENNEPRAGLGAIEQGPKLTLQDNGGKARVELALGGTDTPRVTLYDGCDVRFPSGHVWTS